MVLGKPKRVVDEIVIIEKYVAGVKVKDILSEYNLARSFFNSILIKNGVELRKRIGYSNPSKLTDDVVEKLIKRYEGGESLSSISRSDNISITALSNCFDKKGFRSVVTSEKTVLNESFFDNIDSEDKAYWLGFFFADGNILDKNYVVQLALNERDKEHLEKFKKIIQWNGEVRRCDRGKKGIIYQISLKNKSLWQGLVKNGLTPRKSLTCKYPDCISEELERHFWRGLIDGDGSIPVMFRYGVPRNMLSLVGSKFMCDNFSKYVNKKIGGNTAYRNSGTIYKVELEGVRAQQMLGILYGDANIYLERKKNLADKKMILTGEDGVRLIEKIYAQQFMEEYHYLEGLPIGVRSYGWFENNLLMGVAAVGVPCAPGIYNLLSDYSRQQIGELRRFVLADDAHGKNNASKFLANVIRLEKKLGVYSVIISYADTTQGHTGTIYRACGAKDLGSTNEELVAIDENNKKYSGRALQTFIGSRKNMDGVRFEKSSGKNRFLFILK
jgi:hypothetical protein